MEKLILPLLMYKEKGSIKKGTKKSMLVVPTWNHLYVIRNNRPIPDQWVEAHREKLQALTQSWVETSGWEKTEKKKVIVNVWVYWDNAAQKDCHNLDKLIMDSFNGIIYDDDCNALLRYQDFDLDIDNPRIEITFEAGDYFDRKERKKELEKAKKASRKGVKP